MWQARGGDRVRKDRLAGGTSHRGVRGTTLLAAVAALVFEACASAGHIYREGVKELRAQNNDRAVVLLSKAYAADPESTRYKAALMRARMRAAQDHFAKGQAYVKAGQTE